MVEDDKQGNPPPETQEESWLRRYPKIENQVEAAFNELHESLRISDLEVHTEILQLYDQVFGWKSTIGKRQTELALLGKFWDDPEFRKQIIRFGRPIARISQGNEVVYVGFTTIESLAAIKELGGGIEWLPVITVAAIGQIVPNFVQVDPKEISNAFEPDCKISLRDPNKNLLERRARFLRYALQLQKEHQNEPITLSTVLKELFDRLNPINYCRDHKQPALPASKPIDVNHQNLPLNELRKLGYSVSDITCARPHVTMKQLYYTGGFSAQALKSAGYADQAFIEAEIVIPNRSAIITPGVIILELAKHLIFIILTAYGVSQALNAASLIANALITLVATALMTVLSVYGWMMSLLRLANHILSWVAFWTTTWCGAEAQLDAVNLSYGFALFGLGQASPWVKAVLGLLLGLGNSIYALQAEETYPMPFKIRAIIFSIWTTLFLTPALTEFLSSPDYGNLFTMTPGVKLTAQIAWSIFYTFPGSMTYYWLQLRNKVEDARKTFFTDQNSLYQVFALYPIRGSLRLIQYAINVSRRGLGMGGIPEEMADWTGVSFFTNLFSSMKLILVGLAGYCTAQTRTKITDRDMNPYKVDDLELKKTFTVLNWRLLDFLIPDPDGREVPARKTVTLSAWDNVWAFSKGLLLWGLFSVFTYGAVEAFSDSSASALNTALGVFFTLVPLSFYDNRVSEMDSRARAKIDAYIEQEQKLADQKVQKEQEEKAPASQAKSPPPIDSWGVSLMTWYYLVSDGALRILQGAKSCENLAKDTFLESVDLVYWLFLNLAGQFNETGVIIGATEEHCQKTIAEYRSGKPGWYAWIMGGIFGSPCLDRTPQPEEKTPLLSIN